MVRYSVWYFIIHMVLTPPATGHTAFNLPVPGARPAGMGGAFVAVADDANSPLGNPAGMSQLLHAELTSYYTHLYGIEELPRLMMAGVIPTPLGGMGFSYHSFGRDLYRETTLAVSYSRPLFSRLFVGLTARSLTLSIERYGAARTAGLDTGVLFLLPAGMRAGAMINGIRQTRIEGEAIPATFHAGVSRTGPRILVTAQIDRIPGQPMTVRVGQEFYLVSRLTLRCGIMTAPSMVFAGLEAHLPLIRTSYAASSHPVLGLTHQVSVTIRFGEASL